MKFPKLYKSLNSSCSEHYNVTGAAGPITSNLEHVSKSVIVSIALLNAIRKIALVISDLKHFFEVSNRFGSSPYGVICCRTSYLEFDFFFKISNPLDSLAYNVTRTIALATSNLKNSKSVTGSIALLAGSSAVGPVNSDLENFFKSVIDSIALLTM